MAAASSDSWAVTADGTLSLIGRGLSELPDAQCRAVCARVRALDLTDNDLADALGGLRHFVRCTDVILDKNGIARLGEACPRLAAVETLWLNNNAVEDLDGILDDVQAKFPALVYLSMLRNPCCPDAYFSEDATVAYQRYRNRVIYRLPSLQFLDSTEISAAERKEALRVGRFARVAAPDQSQYNARAGDGELLVAAPEDGKLAHEKGGAEPPAPAAFLARGRMRYDGTHSEGNRFIQNDDL